MPELQDQFFAAIPSEALEVQEDHLLFQGGYLLLLSARACDGCDVHYPAFAAYTVNLSTWTVKTPPLAGEFLDLPGYHHNTKEIAMPTLTKSLRILLIILNLFLGLTAIGGGIQLLTGFYVPPVEMLSGSPFTDYTVPGLALGLIVGGGALTAAVLLIRKNKFAPLASAFAGLIIMVFEFVEVLAIGFPEGAAGFMQLLYFGLGMVIVTAALSQWFFELRSIPVLKPQL